jgi:hypothetical protein
MCLRNYNGKQKGLFQVFKLFLRMLTKIPPRVIFPAACKARLGPYIEYKLELNYYPFGCALKANTCSVIIITLTELVQCLMTIFKSPHQLEIQKWQRSQLTMVFALKPSTPALDAAVTTVAIPGRGQPWGIFVQTDGNRRFSPSNMILQLPFHWQAGQHFGAGGARLRLSSLKFKSVIDGQGILARFNSSTDLTSSRDSTMDRGGNAVVASFADGPN